MAIEKASKKTIIPDSGKNQIDLESFNFKNQYMNNFFTIYLPCAKIKPYYKSQTHSYIKNKLQENLPNYWLKLIRICTISEVIGIVPEELENIIFYFFPKKYMYEHYPSYEEGDVDTTSFWLREYINKYGANYNFGYCTSQIFRDICKRADLETFPKSFKKSSALFEFRKIENVRELTSMIYQIYINILRKRFFSWKTKNNHSYRVIKFAANKPFKFQEFKKKFQYLKNPYSNIQTFCNESKSDKGIFLDYNKKDRRFYLPNFLKHNLNL